MLYLPARCVEKQRLLCRSVRVIEDGCNVVEGCFVVDLELVAILLVDGRPACGRVELLAAPAGKLVKLSSCLLVRIERFSICQVVRF